MSKKWLQLKGGDYVLELVLIILGITIAFAVDRCAEGVRKRNEEQEVLDNIKAVLEADIANLETCKSMNAALYKSVKEVHANLKKSGSLNPDTVMEKTRYLYNIIDFKPSFRSLSGMGNVYRLDLINNVELKQRFKQLFDLYEALEEYEEDYEWIFKKRFSPYWKINYNDFLQQPIQREAFIQPEYLNIIFDLRDRLARKSKFYESTLEEATYLLNQMQSPN